MFAEKKRKLQPDLGSFRTSSARGEHNSVFGAPAVVQLGSNSTSQRPPPLWRACHLVKRILTYVMLYFHALLKDYELKTTMILSMLRFGDSQINRFRILDHLNVHPSYVLFFCGLICCFILRLDYPSYGFESCFAFFLRL